MIQTSPDVYQISTRFSNCFLIAGPVPTLVDSCMPLHAGVIARAVGSFGYNIHDVRRLILTHYDVDHIGSAEALRRATGMEVYMHPADMPYVTGEKAPEPFTRVAVAAIARPFMRDGPPSSLQPLEEGDWLDGIHVVHTPGHTPGHVSIIRAGVLIAGDALLTADEFRLPPALLNSDTGQARRSARKLMSYDFHIAVSGHGTPAVDAWAKLERLVRKLGDRN